jgi:hypothetical protein
MNVGKIHVSTQLDFYIGDTVVLVAADRNGLEELEAALTQTGLGAGIALTMNLGSQNHTFIVGKDAESVELHEERVIWRISELKRRELVEKLEAMRSNPGPCHHHVDDIAGPTATLILSRDEYLDPVLITSREPGS